MPSSLDQPPTVATVRVLGQFAVQVPADTAHLRVTVTGTGTTQGRAASSLRAAYARVTRVLTRFDATVSHAQTHRTSLTAAPATDSDSPQWTARAEVGIDVHDVTGVSALYTALLKARPEAVTGPWWSLRTDHAVHAMVRREAVRDAAARARVIAEAAGSRVVALDWICDPTTSPLPLSARTLSDTATDTTWLVEPAPQTVAVTVEAQYQIAPAGPDRTTQSTHEPAPTPRTGPRPEETDDRPDRSTRRRPDRRRRRRLPRVRS